jgi:hypothetical protein
MGRKCPTCGVASDCGFAPGAIDTARSLFWAPRIGDDMTTFNDREQGFEKKFAMDEETEFKATARRNRLLGEWAAGLMGLETVAEYARAVVKSDFEQPGDEDVLRKVFGDLKSAGVGVSEGDVRMKMDELQAVAREQVKSGN